MALINIDSHRAYIYMSGTPSLPHSSPFPLSCFFIFHIYHLLILSIIYICIILSPTSTKDSLFHYSIDMTLLKRQNARDRNMAAIGPSSGVGKGINKKGA